MEEGEGEYDNDIVLGTFVDKGSVVFSFLKVFFEFFLSFIGWEFLGRREMFYKLFLLRVFLFFVLKEVRFKF